MSARKLCCAAALVLSTFACVNRAGPGQTTTTSAPSPGHAAPASPAESWTTSGGPANAGAPSTGAVVDPKVEPVHDGGVW